VIVNEVNSAPVLTVPANQTINELSTLVLTNTATDANLPANTLTFSLVSAPSGVSLDSNSRSVDWRAAQARGPRTNLIQVQVTENVTAALSDTQSITVIVTGTNTAPVLTVPPNQTIDELSTLVLTNSATDANLPANTLTFSLVSAPSGVSLDSNS